MTSNVSKERCTGPALHMSMCNLPSSNYIQFSDPICQMFTNSFYLGLGWGAYSKWNFISLVYSVTVVQLNWVSFIPSVIFNYLGFNGLRESYQVYSSSQTSLVLICSLNLDIFSFRHFSQSNCHLEFPLTFSSHLF